MGSGIYSSSLGLSVAFDLAAHFHLLLLEILFSQQGLKCYLYTEDAQIYTSSLDQFPWTLDLSSYLPNIFIGWLIGTSNLMCPKLSSDLPD